jgi:transposase
MSQNTDAESIDGDIERRTRKKYSSEEKIRIVLAGLRGEASVTEVRGGEEPNSNTYCKWTKESLGAGKNLMR